MRISNTKELRKAMRTPYVWPGGPPLHIILEDGFLCHFCARFHYRDLSKALRDPRHSDSGWRPIAAGAAWEGPEQCTHCNSPLDTAY